MNKAAGLVSESLIGDRFVTIVKKQQQQQQQQITSTDMMG